MNPPEKTSKISWRRTLVLAVVLLSVTVGVVASDVAGHLARRGFCLASMLGTPTVCTFRTDPQSPARTYIRLRIPFTDQALELEFPHEEPDASTS